MKWEYKVVSRTRDVIKPAIGGLMDVRAAASFVPNGEEMLAMLAELGEDEWELVAVTTRNSKWNSPLTSEEFWVFKRPKA